MNISLTDKEKVEENNKWPCNLEDFTPLMKQYLEIKYKNDLDVLLLFRVGDFYETFFEDAKTISKELELTLTGRSEANYPTGRIPMAGVPAKAVVSYVSKLLDKGYRVAICDQMEDPKFAKGIVKREVIKLLTPGTILETSWLPQAKNNYIASVLRDKRKHRYGFAYTDVSCGEFYFTELAYDELLNELYRINPSELLIPLTFEKTDGQIIKEKILDIDHFIQENWFCTGIENEYYREEFANKRLKEEFNLYSLDSLDSNNLKLGLFSASSILAYIDKTQISEKPNFEKLIPYHYDSFLNIDKTTRKNLELTETIKDKSYEGSLLWAIDFTKTQMGKRRLRNWIEQPLVNITLINERLQCVEEFIENKYIFHELSNILEKIFDLERLTSRLSALSVNGRELVALKESLLKIPALTNLFKGFKSVFFQNIVNYPKEINDVIAIIDNAILDFPSALLTEGNLIKPSYNNELNQLKEIIENGHSWLSSFESIERQKTGIKNLKVGFNRAFGYFVEISKGNLSFVPPEYICRQTMVNSSRFITSELKDFEQKALNADQRITSLEYELFCQIREQIKNYCKVLRELAFNVSVLDALFSLAQAAVVNNYKKPFIDNSSIVHLKNSRHPVVEKKVGFNNFVPNDCYLESIIDNSSKPQLMILTGPNMAGKSTFMRQIALNVILAQIGSFVACDDTHIGVADQIFTRVGASDDIAEGQSTFMVEMIETSVILNKMTGRSLILLDEVGRGTSTYDGVAIAWALAEYLCNAKNKKPRTIFATHFHELNGLADFYKSICNYQVTVKEEEGHVIFLRKVVPGGADRSYGIEVARMAGLPKELLVRAKSIMETMHNKSKASPKRETIKSQIESGQLSLFNN